MMALIPFLLLGKVKIEISLPYYWIRVVSNIRLISDDSFMMNIFSKLQPDYWLFIFRLSAALSNLYYVSKFQELSYYPLQKSWCTWWSSDVQHRFIFCFIASFSQGYDKTKEEWLFNSSRHRFQQTLKTETHFLHFEIVEVPPSG